MTSRIQLTLALARKDWRLFWADRRAAVLCFVVPVLLASAFGTIFHRPATGATTKLPLIVVIEDDGPFTRQIAADLLATAQLDAKVATRSEAEHAVAERHPAIAVVLPSGFERLKEWKPLSAAARPEVRILHHPAAIAERQWAEGIVAEAVMKRVAREAFGSDKALAAPFAIDAVPVSPHARTQFNSYSHSFCGMTLQYLLFWGMESGLLFLRERRRSVWTRMRAAAVPLSCAIAGKSLATAFIALLQLIITFSFGYLAFGVTIGGSVIGFALLAMGVCTLAAATGLLVAALGGTEARARHVSILVILGVSMLGGLWVPTFLLPAWARDVSLALPTTWAMRGLETVTWQGGGFWTALPSVAAVGSFALVLLAVAALWLKLAERNLRQGKVPL